jgi:hypothetical protein
MIYTNKRLDFFELHTSATLHQQNTSRSPRKRSIILQVVLIFLHFSVKVLNSIGDTRINCLVFRNLADNIANRFCLFALAERKLSFTIDRLILKHLQQVVVMHIDVFIIMR